MLDKNELIQEYIVNEDLIKLYNMETGKISGQVAHVATLLSNANYGTKNYNEWLSKGQKKIIKKAREKDLLNLMESLDEDGIHYEYIRDFGLTVLPPNTLTVVGIGPLTRDEISKYVNKRWRLL